MKSVDVKPSHRKQVAFASQSGENGGGMDRDTHCGLIADFIELETDPGCRIIRFDPLGGSNVDTESKC